MSIEIENKKPLMPQDNLTSFINEIEKLSSKKDIAQLLIARLALISESQFVSFVEKEESSSLKVLCQSGNDSLVKNVFSKKMCEEIFDWVMNQNQSAIVELAGKGNFIFLPVCDFDRGVKIEHGIVVIQAGALGNSKELNSMLSLYSKLTALVLTKISGVTNQNKYDRLKEQIKSELQLTAKIQKSISCGCELSKKISFSVLEDEGASFNGNLWWVGELGADISLVLIAQVLCKGSPSALLSGYILGEMNSLKTKAEISLNPKEVLQYLNRQLNMVFKDTGITVNAWYGVFNIAAKQVRYANANHVDPFVVGPEQQVSKLITGIDQKGQPLGVNIDTTFFELVSNISSGSKLIICTKDLLEQAAKIGDRYDHAWFPQVLETIGTLSVAEMRNRLDSILSENLNGTAQKPSRLALLLEIPA